MTACLLCQRELAATTVPYLFLHEEAEDCLVRVTDKHGISVDDRYIVEGDDILYRNVEPEVEPEVLPVDEDAIEIVQFLPIEEAILRCFKAAGLQRLGGRSSGSGWTGISLFQRCPYAWMRRHIDPLPPEFGVLFPEIEPLAIGTLVHTYLALYYQRMIVPGYPLSPEDVNHSVRLWGCNPKVFDEGWRLFSAYRIYYQHENIMPLAVEYDLRDPRTNQSCRYDLIAFFPEERPGILPGTYFVEHKTAARFDANTLEAWHGDGEVLGQVMHWQRLGMERRFGPLRGGIVNLLGKQKTPEFHRTIVAPTAFTLEQHRDDLRRWDGRIALAKATNDFPHSRNNCIRGYSRCDLWHHCNTGM